MLRTYFVAALAALATASPAIAQGCVPSSSTPLVDSAEVSAAAEQPHYYVATDACPECASGSRFVLYEESNGLGGLQRADEWVDDTCRGIIAGDALREWW